MQTAWPRGAQRHRPRASATAGITKGTAHGIASATTVSAGRRSHRKVVPLFCTSLPPGSVRRAAATVGTVFRCVASRNRERVFYWGSLRLISNRACGQKSGSASLASQSPVGAQPSRGESISFLSPAQAAGAPTFCDATESRQRTQPRGLRPLGHPPPTGQRITNRENSALRPPPEALQNPGWGAERHPRDSAMPKAREAPGHCVKSDTAGTSGRHPLRIPRPTI